MQYLSAIFIIIYANFNAAYSERKTIAQLTAQCNSEICETCIFEKCRKYPAGNFSVSITCRGGECLTCLNDLPCETTAISRGGSVVDIDAVPDNIRRKSVSYPMVNNFLVEKPQAGALTRGSESNLQCQNGICRTCVDGYCKISLPSNKRSNEGVQCYNGVCVDMADMDVFNESEEERDTFAPPFLPGEESNSVILQEVPRGNQKPKNTYNRNRGPISAPRRPGPTRGQSSATATARSRCSNGVCQTCVNGKCTYVRTGAVGQSSYARSRNTQGPGYRSSSTVLGYQANPLAATSLAQKSLNQQMQSLLTNPYCVSSSFCANTHVCVNSRCIVNPNGRRHMEYKTCVVIPGLPTGCPAGWECDDRACFEPMQPKMNVKVTNEGYPIVKPNEPPVGAACRYHWNCGSDGLCIRDKCIPGPQHSAYPCKNNSECPAKTTCLQSTCFDNHVVQRLINARRRHFYLF